MKVHTHSIDYSDICCKYRIYCQNNCRNFNKETIRSLKQIIKEIHSDKNIKILLKKVLEEIPKILNTDIFTSNINPDSLFLFGAECVTFAYERRLDAIVYRVVLIQQKTNYYNKINEIINIIRFQFYLSDIILDYINNMNKN